MLYYPFDLTSVFFARQYFACFQLNVVADGDRYLLQIFMTKMHGTHNMPADYIKIRLTVEF